MKKIRRFRIREKTCDELGAGEDGWIKRSGNDEFCYKFVVSPSDTDTWEKAEYNCQMEGGHLASVHDNEENNFFMVNMKRNTIENAFLGLHVNNDDQFEWTDGTVADYFSWSKGGLS